MKKLQQVYNWITQKISECDFVLGIQLFGLIGMYSEIDTWGTLFSFYISILQTNRYGFSFDNYNGITFTIYFGKYESKKYSRTFQITKMKYPETYLEDWINGMKENIVE